MFFYMSFCDPYLPKGTRFLGAVIVSASDFIDAVIKTKTLGINPGGEIQSVEFPDNSGVPEEFIDRLLSREDIMRFDRVMAEKRG